MNARAFTLIEVVMVIVILVVLAAVAIPKYVDLRDSARKAAEEGVVGGVRAGIHTYYTENKAWPTALDPAGDGDASSANPFFTNVLAQGGVTSGWSKSGAAYTGPNAGSYTYDNSDGSFN